MNSLKSLQNLRVGIIGGGQLGRMMILEGKKMGMQFTVLDPDKNAPAVSLADQHIQGNYHDREKLRQIAKTCDVLTYEFEHIDGPYLQTLEEEGYFVTPSSYSLQIIQDKFRQNTFLKEQGLPTPNFRRVESLEDLRKAGEDLGYPMVLKAATGGYDGKGNALIQSREGMEGAFFDLKKGKEDRDLMAEAFVDFEKEISIIAARGKNGETAVYPPSENHHEKNILKHTILPAEISGEVEKKAMDLGKETLEKLKGQGVFAIELFVTKDGRVLVNEIAPRVHNSGHYTIEASETSQFEQHLRGILGLPLGSTKLKRPVAGMINLLGEGKISGKPVIQGYEKLLATEGAHLHFYEKKVCKPGRKMGHITVLGESRDEVLVKLKELEKTVKIYAEEEQV